jgi:polyvinyl alcohol dehydrogenase (cytochrome)
MFALDGKTGDILWRYSTTDPVNGTVHSVNAGPAVVDGTVYWGSGYARSAEGNGNNKFYAFSLDGQ